MKSKRTVREISKVLPVALMLLMVCSCSNTFDFFLRLKKGSTLVFEKSTQTTRIKDSVKIMFKGSPIPVAPRKFQITPLEEGEFKDILVTLSGGKGDLTADGNPITLNPSTTGGILEGLIMGEKGKTIDLVFTPTLSGSYTRYMLRFASRNDDLEPSQEPSISEFTTYENYPPVPSFKATPVDPSGDKFEYEFDARATKDVDEEGGGAVSLYTYVIIDSTGGRFTIKTDKPVIRYAFHKLGAYAISLTATDNESATSPKPFEVNITIE